MRRTEFRSAGRRRVVALAVGVSLAALTAAGCSAAAASSPPAKLAITPADGSRGVLPGAPILVTARHGKLRDVIVTTAAGPVRGYLAADGIWRSAQPLATGTNYTVTATAIGANHKKVTTSSTFQTLTPQQTFSATITALGTDPNVSGEIVDGHQYGVGIPITIMFSRPITDRAAVEQAIQLRTSRPVVGAWYWQDDKTVIFRPRQYWPQYTTVAVDANFDGVQAAPGIYGDRDVNLNFSIGPSLIVVASASNHYMDVYYKDRFFGRWPISTGRPGDDTPDGTYLTTFKNNPQLMVGPGYRLEVPWSVDITYSGDFIHDAYWSVGVQGATNVSHGCINISPAHAETYYIMEEPGDPATVTGSPSAGIQGNGWTEWFLSWSEWLKGSATGDAVVAGPSGSALVSPGSLPATTARGPLYQPSSDNANANT